MTTEQDNRALVERLQRLHHDAEYIIPLAIAALSRAPYARIAELERANARLRAALKGMLDAFDDRQLNPNFRPFPSVAKAEAALKDQQP